MSRGIPKTELWKLADELNERALALLLSQNQYAWYEARGLLYARDALRKKISLVPRNYEAWLSADKKLAAVK